MSFSVFLIRNWWVIVFLLMGWGIYLQSVHKKNIQIASLKEKVQRLSEEKNRALEKQADLILRIKSQDDPDYLEMVLKERLGVVAEGETKVVFK